MTKYCVVMEETIRYFVDIEAESEDDARKEAEEQFVQDEKPFETFRANVEDRAIRYVTKP